MSRDLGFPVQNWTPPQKPNKILMDGKFARLEKFDLNSHSADLHAANTEDTEGLIWDFLPYGPFSSLAGYHRWAKETASGVEPFFYAIRDKEAERWCGVASYLRINPTAGSIEVGHINYSPALQRTRAATEAMYLMMKWAFESGYRRYEWKCNALNTRSRAAAQRYGFSYEGVFRQAAVSEGRNRDTAWFAVIDTEWSALEAAFQAWLSESNFDIDGQQIERLGNLTSLVRMASDPGLEK